MGTPITFLLIRKLLLLLGIGPMPDEKDVEIAVLRHQLSVMHRQVARPRFSPTDRAVLATLAKLLPRERWGAFLVTPATLLRWHRELVARHWTFPRVVGGAHNALDDEVVELIVRLARTRGGAISASLANVESSASPSLRRVSGTCFDVIASNRHHAERVRRGQSSFAPKLPARSRATSSPSTP